MSKLRWIAIVAVFGCFCETPVDSPDPCQQDSYRVVTFNSSNLVSSDEIYSAEGTLIWYYSFEHDGDGNMISAVRRESDGTLIDFVMFELDENGNDTVDVYLDADSIFTGFSRNEYNSNGDLIGSRDYSADSALEEETQYVLDSRGFSTESSTYDENGTLLYRYAKQRDGNGLLIKETIFNQAGTKVAYKSYEYDSQTRKITIWYYDCTSSATALAKKKICRSKVVQWRTEKGGCLWANESFFESR